MNAPVYMKTKSLRNAHSHDAADCAHASEDFLIRWAAGAWTGPLLRRLGLPSPRQLAREAGGYRADEWVGRVVVAGGVPGGYALAQACSALTSLGATVHPSPTGSTAQRVDIAVFDATACTDVASLAALHGHFGPLMRQLAPSARILVLAADPAEARNPVQRAAVAAVEGFVRTLAKEVGRHGSTANLLYLSCTASDRLLGPMRFFCSRRSAYVSGRAVRVTSQVPQGPLAAQGPRLHGKVALVTGAARGLGAATARRLAEEGAGVICVDVPQAQAPLQALAASIGGQALLLDITAPGASAQIAQLAQAQGGRLDLVVHNAGITRDRTLQKMTSSEWSAVMAVNLQAVIDLDAAFDAAGLLADGGREVCLSSISGIAGNLGQANYAASKAALMGYARARALQLAARGITVNAVAPGFIETEMTRAIPTLIREAGRRLNALSQGGLPRDVAETIAFLALPEASGITGQTIRVCGQALIGA